MLFKQIFKNDHSFVIVVIMIIGLIEEGLVLLGCKAVKHSLMESDLSNDQAGSGGRTGSKSLWPHLECPSLCRHADALPHRLYALIGAHVTSLGQKGRM